MKERRQDAGYLHDERGSKSMGRFLLCLSLGFAWPLIYADSFIAGVDVPDPAYAFLGIIFGGLLAWVAGPRMTQHLGEVASGIAQAKRSTPFSSYSYTSQNAVEGDDG